MSKSIILTTLPTQFPSPAVITGYPSGHIVKKTSYCSGYGVGARTTTTSTSWYGLNINGTGKDTAFPADNVNIRHFDKLRGDTHLRIQGAFPIYITPGNTGVGFRTRMLLSNNPALYMSDVNYFTVGILETGMAERWGAAGYGGVTAAIINLLFDTRFGNSAVMTFSGRLHFYFQGINWASTETAFWIDYSNDYPKYAVWTVEEYIP
jgi:hypothetical protein